MDDYATVDEVRRHSTCLFVTGLQPCPSWVLHFSALSGRRSIRKFRLQSFRRAASRTKFAPGLWGLGAKSPPRLQRRIALVWLLPKPEPHAQQSRNGQQQPLGRHTHRILSSEPSSTSSGAGLTFRNCRKLWHANFSVRPFAAIRAKAFGPLPTFPNQP